MKRLHLAACWLWITAFSGALAEETLDVRTLENSTASPPATIKDIAWLEGAWSGSGLGGGAEDIISSPFDGEMMGMFRHMKSDGTVGLYEFYVIAEKDGSLTQRLKHFSRPLNSWEEKDEFVEFPLVAIEENAVYFDGLSYRLDADNRLTVAVRLSADEVAIFNYTKTD